MIIFLLGLGGKLRSRRLEEIYENVVLYVDFASFFSYSALAIIASNSLKSFFRSTNYFLTPSCWPQCLATRSPIFPLPVHTLKYVMFSRSCCRLCGTIYWSRNNIIVIFIFLEQLLRELMILISSNTQQAGMFSKAEKEFDVRSSLS